MPHHSTYSWQGYFNKHQDVVTQARKKGYIARRKMEGQNGQTSPHMTSENEHSAQSSTSTPAYFDEDLMIIAGYLADGVPEGVSDEEMFAKLTQEVRLYVLSRSGVFLC